MVSCKMRSSKLDQWIRVTLVQANWISVTGVQANWISVTRVQANWISVIHFMCLTQYYCCLTQLYMKHTPKLKCTPSSKITDAACPFTYLCGGELTLKGTIVWVCANLKTPFQAIFIAPETHHLKPISISETQLLFWEILHFQAQFSSILAKF